MIQETRSDLTMSLCSGCTLYGGNGGHPEKPVESCLSSATLSGGKAKKLALTACMRKLLTILSARVKNGTPWRDSVGQPAWLSRQLLTYEPIY